MQLFVTEDFVYAPVTHEYPVESGELSLYAKGNEKCYAVPFSSETMNIRVGDKIRLYADNGATLTFTVNGLRLCKDVYAYMEEGLCYNSTNSSDSLTAAKAILENGALLLILLS